MGNIARQILTDIVKYSIDLTLLALGTTKVVFISFFLPLKSPLLGAKCMLKHPDLQMFGLKLNKCEYVSLKLWVELARHNFKWVKM